MRFSPPSVIRTRLALKCKPAAGSASLNFQQGRLRCRQLPHPPAQQTGIVHQGQLELGESHKPLGVMLNIVPAQNPRPIKRYQQVALLNT